MAYHESGHTLVSFRLPHVKSPVKVSIIPREKGALGFSMTEVSEAKLKNKDELSEKICVLLGGRVAEEIFCGNITTGASDDIQKLTLLAYNYVSIYGMDKDISTFYYNRNSSQYSEDLRKKIDNSVHKLIEMCYIQTKKLIAENKVYIESMAQALLEKEILNQEEIADLLRRK